VFSSPFFQKKIEFWSIILQNGTKHHAIFWKKGGYSPFWILASRGSHEGNKFYILDGTKHDPKNFGILHFITPK